MRSPILKDLNNNMYKCVAENGIVLSPYSESPAIFVGDSATPNVGPVDFSTQGYPSSLYIPYGTATGNALASAMYIVAPTPTNDTWQEIFPGNILAGVRSISGTLTARNANYEISFTFNTGTQIMTNAIVNPSIGNVNISSQPYTNAQYFLVPKRGLYYITAHLGKNNTATYPDSTHFYLELWLNGALFQNGVHRFDTMATGTTYKNTILQCLDVFSEGDIVQIVVRYDSSTTNFGLSTLLRCTIKCITEVPYY